jgi:hypothetical protein
MRHPLKGPKIPYVVSYKDKVIAGNKPSFCR